MSKAIIEQIQGLINSTVAKIEARQKVPTSEELSAVAKLVNSLNKLEETLRQPVIKSKPEKLDPKKMSKRDRDAYYCVHGNPDFAEQLMRVK
ncbi:MAG: hypothetical protein WBC61_00535 [Dehalococcoidia bacterium]